MHTPIEESAREIIGGYVMGLFGKNSKAEEAAKKEQQEMQELLAVVMQNAQNLAESIDKVSEKLHSATDVRLQSHPECSSFPLRFRRLHQILRKYPML